MKLTLTSYIQWVESGTLKPYDVVHHYFHKAQDSSLNSFVRFHEQYLSDHLEDFWKLPLHAAPIGIKDIILTKGYETTNASKMLQGYIPPYSATCFEKLEVLGGLMIGKTNMDDAAMGTTNESSFYGPCKNPHDISRVSGWSSGWSAASVSADECLAALGTDTGGSIRLPASWCGIVGMKPTYGRVSRYGVIPMASSLDQVGVLTKNIEDAELLLRSISGHDPKDMTSIDRNDLAEWKLALDLWVKGLKIGVPKQYFWEGLDPKIAERMYEVMSGLELQGAEIVELDIPLLEYGVSTYYILCPAEVSSNIARLDGMRFWHQNNTQDFDTIYDYIAQTRTEGLGKEVQRRIMIGGYVLGSGHIDQYYNKARKVQDLLRQELDDIYTQVDVILGPTAPCVAPHLGAFTDDPMKLYLMDIYTVIANLWGYPAVSIPAGMVSDEGVMMPVGCQLMAGRWNEKVLFQAGKTVEGLAL
jgi:aspartyl-tRNA(Asn)/glutamyl-tRNA(Gln) amidotransferase subunit A